MSPSLEGTMFNRNANLSTRRPLLEEPCRFATAVPQYEPRHNRPLRSAPATPLLTQRNPYMHDPYQYQRQTSMRKPPQDEYHRVPIIRNGYGEKVAYFQNKIVQPTNFDFDRRETELVFRFDTHIADDYFTAPQIPGTVKFSKSSAPVPNGRSYVPVEERLRPDKNGPFVFGVHSPSQFQEIPSRLSDNDYDYADIEEEAGKTAIRDESPTGSSCCDKVNDWKVNGKAKSKRTLNRMFQIKDNRCKRKPSVKLEHGSKKDKIKCVLVGDGAVGKSSLIAAYAQNKFRSEYEPTAYDTFNVVVEVDDRPVNVEICDTAGQDSLSELRALCYPGTDVLMLCFSVVRPETFRSVAERWVKAVAAVTAPVVLVGTQADLAHDRKVLSQLALRGEHVVTEAEARALAATINAEYIETSAKTRTNLKESFDSAILAGLPVITTKKPIWKKLLCLN